MGKYIDRETVVEEINEAISNIAFTSPYQNDVGTMVSGMERVLDIVEDALAIDVVPVVRCKDCKHCTATSDGMVCENALPTKRMMDYYIYGSTILARVGADDFCSYGERKDNE